MTKRAHLSKKSVRTGANSKSGVIVEASRKSDLNPGPSGPARARIREIEESSQRAEQRLGMTRLA